MEALDGAVRIGAAPNEASTVTGFRYECSPDGGGTWPATADVPGTGEAGAQIDGLSNGVEYVCRAFAANDSGMSDASPLSDPIRPCGSFIECNGLTVPIIAGAGAALGGVVLLGLIFIARSRRSGYVVAVVDVVHTANLGHGSTLGLGFVRPAHGRRVDGIVAAKGSAADIRIRKLRNDRFRVRDSAGTHETASGEPLGVVDSNGARHELVLWAFETKAASEVSVRR
jgi:hypothetical protein